MYIKQNRERYATHICVCIYIYIIYIYIYIHLPTHACAHTQQVLGVDREATQDQIRSAYKKAARD